MIKGSIFSVCLAALLLAACASSSPAITSDSSVDGTPGTPDGTLNGTLNGICVIEPGVNRKMVVTMLEDFEDAALFSQRWQKSADDAQYINRITWERSTAHVKEGSYSGHAIYEPHYLVNGGYLTVSMADRNGNENLINDWRPYEYLVFDVYNSSNESTRVRLQLHTSGWDIDLAFGPNQWTEVRIKLNWYFRRENIKSLKFYQEMPHKALEMYFDNIRLEANPYSDLDKLKETLDTITSYRSMITNYGGSLSGLAEPDYASYDTLQMDLFSVNETSLLVTWHESYRTANSTADVLLIATQKVLFEAHGTNQGKVWTYACLGSMVKVMRSHGSWLLPGQPGGSLDLKMAANEYEAGQVVLRVKEGHSELSNVQVTVSDLTCNGCPNIPASQIELSPVGYLNTQSPPYPRQYDGQWPDPILAYLKSFTLADGVWQPIWVEVHTLPNQKAGDYSGIITVTADDGHSQSIPINVKVWDFAVPHEFHFPTSLSFHEGEWTHIDKYRYPDGNINASSMPWHFFEAYFHGTKELSELSIYPHSVWLVELRVKYHNMLLAHRIVPNNPYRDYAPRIDDLQRFKAAGGRDFFLIEAPKVGTGQSHRDARWNKIKAFMTEFEQHPELAVMKPYIYFFDENPPTQFPAVKEISDELQSRLAAENYNHKVILTSTAKDKSHGKDTYSINGDNVCLDDSMDSWTPLTSYYEATLEDVASAKSRGKKVWWYVCNAPFHPVYGNWYIERPPAAYRLLTGFKPFKYKVDGILHWTMQYWKTGSGASARSLKYTMTGGPVITVDNYTGRTFGNINGDGLLLYPGDDSPIATMRLKGIRDGLEDYEYLWLLQYKAGMVEANPTLEPYSGWLTKAQAALAVKSDVVNTLIDFDRTITGYNIEIERQSIATLIMEASNITYSP